MRPFGLENFIKLSLKGVRSYIVDRIRLGCDRNKWPDRANKVMHFFVTQNGRNSLSSWGNLSVWRTTVLHGFRQNTFFKTIHMYNIHPFNKRFTCIYQNPFPTNMMNYMKGNLSYVECTSSSKGRRIRGIRGERCSRKEQFRSIYVWWCKDLFIYLFI